MQDFKGMKGQAFVEWALMAPLFTLMALGIFAFAQWFLIHQQLLIAAKQGAFLYSSGRLSVMNVKRVVQDNLRRGWPSLDIPLRDIHVGRSQVPHARRYRLDEVKVVYHPTRNILRFFTRTQPLEETCVIKHAPGYWKFSGFQVGPPVRW